MDDFDDQIKQTTKNPWYAVRTFNCQELKISDFLKERKKVHFVPMTYVEKETDGRSMLLKNAMCMAGSVQAIRWLSGSIS